MLRDYIHNTHINKYGQMQLGLLTIESIIRIQMCCHPRTSPSLFFVGSNYYCESGAGSSLSQSACHLSNSLWDGAGCSANNTCCSNTDQAWFHHQLSSITLDDIEVRICRNASFSYEGILTDMLELYIQ